MKYLILILCLVGCEKAQPGRFTTPYQYGAIYTYNHLRPTVREKPIVHTVCVCIRQIDIMEFSAFDHIIRRDLPRNQRFNQWANDLDWTYWICSDHESLNQLANGIEDSIK